MDHTTTQSPPFPHLSASDETKPRPLYSGRQALVVESDPVTRRRCGDALEALGFRVETAESGVIAVMVVRDEILDIILLGRQLRDVSAREAIHWLRVQPGLRGTPIIVLEAESGIDHFSGMPQLFVLSQKPVTPAAIADAVAKALAQTSTLPNKGATS